MVSQTHSKTQENTAWNILIIDDDEDDFLIAREMLKEARGRKFHIQWARTYEAGRQELFSDHYHAALVDYDLGQRSGIELIREANGQGVTTPLILFTGRGNFEVDVEAMEAGATLYLTKGEANPLLLERSIRYAIEIKQKEQALMKAEEKFAQAFRSSPAALAITRSSDGRYIEVNESLCRVTGYDRDEIIGQTALELGIYTFPDQRAEIIRLLREQGNVRNYEIVVRTKSGITRNVLASIDHIEIDREPCMLATLIDITEREQAEEALRQAHQRAVWMARFPDENPNPVARVSAGGVILYCNGTSASLPGWNFVVGQALTGPMLRVVERALQSGKEVREDILLSERYYSISIMPIRGEDYVNIYGTDITERKQASESLLRQSEALRESEERFRRAIMSAPYPVMIRRQDGRVMMINKTWAEITGYSLEDIPTTAEWTKRAYGKSAEQVQTLMRNEDYSQSAKKGWGEFEVTTRSGAKRTWDFSTSDLGKDQEGLSLVLVMAVDVTERKRTEAALQDFAEKLQRSNQELEQFAFVASHDLQEPLRKIILFGNSLRQRLCDTPDETVEDYLGRMQNAAGRMKAMIDGLLDLSRVNARGGEFTLLNTKQLVADVVSDLEVRIEAANGQVEVLDLPPFEADAMQIRQLFQNLIGNAIKFQQPGVPPVVRISGELIQRNQPPVIEVRVEDNGIGFDPQYAGQIFQPFTRLHGRTEYEGTGLGLAICKKIVERHHGAIEVQSAPGKGSIFTVRLPVAPHLTASPQSASPSPAPTQT